MEKVYLDLTILLTEAYQKRFSELMFCVAFIFFSIGVIFGIWVPGLCLAL